MNTIKAIIKNLLLPRKIGRKIEGKFLLLIVSSPTLN